MHVFWSLGCKECKRAACVFLYLLTQYLLCSWSCIAIAETVGVPTVSLVRPEKSGFRFFERQQIGLGVYREFAQHRTQNRYDTPGLGVFVSYQEALRASWSGGLVLRWSEWNARSIERDSSGNAVDSVAPMSLFSTVTFSPPYQKIFDIKFLELVGKYLRPQLCAGFGYTFFFINRGIEFKKSSAESSEPSVTYGTGLRVVWPSKAALRFGWEKWRGVRTFRYTAEIWILEVQFADVDAF